jgi:hypothetical protein
MPLSEGQMYGVGDVIILWKLYAEKYPEPHEPLTAAERKSLIDEVDQCRALYEKNPQTLKTVKPFPVSAERGQTLRKQLEIALEQKRQAAEKSQKVSTGK